MLATVAAMRLSWRVAFAVSWVVFGVAAYFAWRKVLAVPNGRGDLTGLVVATVAGALGLIVLASWLKDY